LLLPGLCFDSFAAAGVASVVAAAVAAGED